MTDRVNSKERLGVNAFERVVLKELKWIFRDQPFVDIGIDATIERVKDNNPTGEQIAVQIKAGLGNVSINKEGNFDYYLSNVHFEYWLSYPIPVIIVLYDDVNEMIYWNSVFKRNMSRTKGGHKLTIKKDSVFSIDSISELENILNIYQSKLVVDDDFNPDDGDELLEYCTNILIHSCESLVAIRRIIDSLDKVYKEQELIMQKFINEHPNGADKSIVDKALKMVIANYTIGHNVFRTRMSSELPIMVETHIKALLYTNKYIFPHLDQPDFLDVAIGLVDEFTKETNEIHLLKTTIGELSSSFKKDNPEMGNDLARSKNNCAIILDDYVCELNDLVELIESCVSTIKNAIKN